MEKDDNEEDDKANNNKMETKQWNGVCLDDGTGRNAVYIDLETGKVIYFSSFLIFLLQV
jgi:hypothetical protein